MDEEYSILRIALGSDHAGYVRKEAILKMLEKEYEVIDFGTFTDMSVDYPDFAHPVSVAVADARVDYGILFCGSGNGVAITANKHPGIRAGIAWTSEISTLARLHNDCNILCIPCRFVDQGLTYEIVQSFLTTTFEGGRHGRRVGKINCE